MRILIIEDEPRMLELLRQGLQERNCAVMTAADGDVGLQIAMAYEFDLILLDIGLPHRDGFQVVQALRVCSRNTRVLMLTARDSEDDIIRGLDLGADGYMTKPFSFPELVARLQAIHRPRRKEDEQKIEIGGLTVDLARRCAVRDSSSIDLSRSEFNLLLSLVRSAGHCVSRQKLKECVWGSEPGVGHGALDVLVNSLRGKIDGPYGHKFIRTVRGEGYVLTCQLRQMEGSKT